MRGKEGEVEAEEEAEKDRLGGLMRYIVSGVGLVMVFRAGEGGSERSDG